MLAAGNVALAVYAVSDLLVVAMIVSDLVTRRRVHASLVWGGLALIATQYLQEVARHTDAERATVAWLQS
jgi:hypothetical protein